MLPHPVLRPTTPSRPDRPSAFAWQGGKPTLLGVGFYRTAGALVRPAMITVLAATNP